MHRDQDSATKAREAERRWLAAELHDGPIQHLASVGFVVDRTRKRLLLGETPAALDALDRVRDEVISVISSLRRLMAELRPPALDEFGLEGALRDYLRRFENEWHIGTSLTATELGEAIDEVAEVIVYRIVQEALTNVRKHAAATRVHVALSVTRDRLYLRVHDNGSGFDADAAERMTGTDHYGLCGMRERVESANGTWQVTSAPGVGTSISATLPR